MAKRKSLKRARLALFTAAFVICGIPPTTIGKIKLAQKAEAESNANVTLSGEGTVESPYLIGTKAELQSFRDITVGENGQTRNSSASARLTADIDLGGSSNPWNQIGSYSMPYSGTFDGAGYKVSGVYIDKPNNSYVGFFTLITNATIKNLTVAGQITGSRDVGGLVGGMGSYSTGNNLIYNCTNECNVTSAYTSTASNGNDSGGLVGYVNGSGNVIRSCVNRGNVTTANIGVYSHVGGILGYSMKAVTIRNCVNYGNVTAQEYTAGIVGYISSSSGKTVISGCYNKGIITSNRDGIATTGGIVGHIYANNSDRALVEYCGNDGKIITKSSKNGGIAGSITYGKVFACYNTATIEGATANGLISDGSRLEISNCYNTGTTSATSPKTDVSAGICSASGSANYPLDIHHVFNTGSITNKDGSTYPYTRRGSIAADPREGTVTNAYYLKGSYKQGIGYFNTPSTTATATELTAEQMKDPNSFPDFDFENIWYMGPNHPLLRHSHDFAVTADQANYRLNAKCERPFCEDSDVTYSLTLHAPTLERERSGGNAEATLDAEELATFNDHTGLNVSSENITYEKIENNQVTSLGTTAPTTFGEYRVKLTVGREFVSHRYTIAKLEVDFKENVTLDGEESTSTVSNLNGETATALLTDEEIDQYINGADVNINLKVTTEAGNLKIPALDKAVVKNALTPESGMKEGAYLDLSLYKTVQKKDEPAAEPVAIHESANAFNITLDIPEDIVNAPYGATRTFSIVRVHNGVAETLSSTVSDGKISFSTNKFSTYLIAYNDTYEAEGEFIEFTPAIVGDNPVYITSESVGNLYTVKYKITHNDGFNSILLIPQYDTSVFDIASIDVNEDALGAATISEGSGTKKILLENTGNKYSHVDGEDESFLTIVYRLKTATPGDYRFGLDINSTGDNNVSAAYYIANGEQKGNQTRVPLVVNEPTLTLITVQEGKIKIGTNTSSTATEDYLFTYSKTEVGVQLVNEFTPGSTNVEYTYNGDATPVINWYEADMTNPSAPEKTGTVLASAPVQAGYYFIGISAPETAAYTAAEEKFALVHILPLDVDVTIDNKQSEYKDNLEELTYTTNVQPFEGDDFGIELSTEATNTSPVGDYIITGSTNGTVGSYVFNFTNGTYTIKTAKVTITAFNQQAEYTGSEPYVDKNLNTAYTVEGYKDNLSTLDVIITKTPGVDVGSYDITPSLSVEPENYSFEYVTGVFSIVSQKKDTDYFEEFFSGKTLTYNGEEQNLLELVKTEDEWWNYSAENNWQKNANIGEEKYTIGVTITLSKENADRYTRGQTKLYFTITGKINPAQITISAVDKTSKYGETTQELTYTITEGFNYNGELTIEVATESPITASTDVGEYAITVSTNSDTNYTITLDHGTYTVTKGQATATASANNVYYNRDLEASATGSVNTLPLNPIIKYYSDSECTQEVTPINAGTYYAKAIIGETDNYFGATSVAVSFEILPVRLEGVSFEYNCGQASWTAVAKDTGKTSTETGVETKALKGETIITYYVYDGDTPVATINSGDERIFNALASTTYKVVARASDTNYLDSESIMIRAYKVSFNEGEHVGNPEGEVSNMPDPQYIFEGQSAIEPVTDPSVPSCTFTAWTLNDVEYVFSTPISGDITIVAKWDAITYTITLKYTSDSETLGADLFKIEGLYLNATVDYTSSNLNPTKDSSDAGIYYTFANKWMDSNNVQYNAVNNVISGYTVAGDMTFVALYDTNYNSFTITYHFSTNESTEEYTQYGDVQSVQYGSEILYREYTGSNVNWFKADYWYADAERTSVVPVRMPNHNIDVYGTYKFDIGLGDVNADGSVTTDDITLYRQWIVGGYEMTVVEKGTEWDLVNSGTFDPSTRYYLKRVADNNLDGSRDVRDVSITRMAIVSGYDWDISSGTSVSGQGIDRTVTVTSINGLISALGQSGRARIYADLADTEAVISIASNQGDLYLDLNEHTLTVKSLALSTAGINATIYVRNGTIVTTDGITIVAPNGNVIIEDVIGYINESQVNLQAADNSLHLAGTVKFYRTVNEQNVPAPINVEEGTHVVIEQNAAITIEKIVVTEDFAPNPEGEVTLDNNTDTQVIVDGNVKNYTISTLVELIEAIGKGGDYGLAADIIYSGTLVVSKDVSINLNGHTLRSSNSVAIGVNNGATLTLSGNGNVFAQEACVMAFDGSSIVINGGTYTSYDNFVVGTNGTNGRGNNNITINGGTFNGQIQSAGYVACGIYVANNDTVVVNGGTFNITNGCGILARSGSTTVDSGVVFNVVGDGSTGKVGDSNITVPTGKVLVLDLAANYPGGEPTLVNNSTYKVAAVVESLTEINTVKNNVSAIVLANDITSNYYNPIGFVNDMDLYLNGKTITCTDDVALRVSNDATLTIYGNGNVVAQEACVMAFDGSKIVINGGTYTAIDNFVLGTNGSNGRGNNSITVNGGTFNGGITSSGYVACGIYVANSDTVIVNGGTFNITNGVGILARSGNTTINEGATFNVTGDGTLGKVGDSKVTVPSGSNVVVDYAADYPGGEPTVIDNKIMYLTYVVGTADDFKKACFDYYGVYYNSPYVNYVVLAGDITIDYQFAYAYGATLNLNGHNLTTTNTIYVYDSVNIIGQGKIIGQGLPQGGYVLSVDDIDKYGATLTIGKDVTVSTNSSYGITVYTGGTLVVNGKVEATGEHSSAISGNGNEGLGGTTIIINEGAVISANGCATIYQPQSGTLTITGGTINNANGVGIVLRSGNATISNGVMINANGNGTLFQLGDSRVVLPTGESIVVDNGAGYPGGTPTLTNNSSYTAYVIEA